MPPDICPIVFLIVSCRNDYSSSASADFTSSSAAGSSFASSASGAVSAFFSSSISGKSSSSKKSSKSSSSCNCGHCADNGKHPKHRILILVLVSLLQCLKKLFYLYHNCHPFRSVLRPSLLTCSHSTLLSHSVQNDHFVTSISQSLRFYYKNFIRVTPLPSSALQRMQTFFSRRPGQN